MDIVCGWYKERSSEIVYSAEPVKMAKQWEKLGASFCILSIWMVLTGEPRNLEIVKEIIRK